MKTKGGLTSYFPFLIFLVFLILPSPLYAAMQDYCLVPPYVQTDIPPNIMLLPDTSCDMSGPGYHYPGGDDAGLGQPQPSYQQGRAYIGLFEPNLFYTYVTASKEWRILPPLQQPILPALPPLTCNNVYPTQGAGNVTCCSDYYCTPNSGTTKYFKGAFMNFISASRFDIMMRVLIGGWGPADNTGNINRFTSFSAIPCTASVACTPGAPGDLMCQGIFGSESKCGNNGKCTSGEREWEWVDPVSHCKFEIERGVNEAEFEIEGESHSFCSITTSQKCDATHPCPVGETCTSSVQTCTITGKTEFESEGVMVVATDRYSDNSVLPPGTVKTTGLVQEYWQRAFWGLSVINSANLSQTKVASCFTPKTNNDPAKDNPTIQSFISGLTAPGNQPTQAAWMNLATAYTGVIDYFKNTGGATYTASGPNCNASPFTGDPTACRKNFVLTLSSTYSVGGSYYASTDCSNVQQAIQDSCNTYAQSCGATCTSIGLCTTILTQALVQDSCYAYADSLAANGLRDLSAANGTQNLYHFGVFTMGQDYENTAGCDWKSTVPTPNKCRFKNKTFFRAATQAGGGMAEGQTQFFEAPQPEQLEGAIRAAIEAILKRVSSGTAASVLASGEGSGANLIQATFYPRRKINDTMLSWIGALQNLWYYIDPFFTNSSIREDTLANHILDLSSDDIAMTYFDPDKQATMVKRFVPGNPPTLVTPDIPIENLVNLWEAGRLLWKRDPSDRKIYTTIDGTNLLTMPSAFPSPVTATLAPYLQATDLNANGSNLDEAETIIRYIRGEDFYADLNLDGVNDYRLRTATLNGATHVWKLSDVLNSTPKIAAWIPLQNYDVVYKDTSYGPRPDQTPLLNDPSDPTHFITTAGYKSRGMVFAGANDGMLHAFKLGRMELDWGQNKSVQAARLVNPETGAVCSPADLSPCGKEMWAFIPKNVLPYLKYLMDPNYCHVYSVDLTPFIFDASIGAPGSGDVSNLAKPNDSSTWRTLLIGGMRYGGACRGTTALCADVSGDGLKDCVNTPVDVSGAGVGFSSYFALDITETLADPSRPPQLLWEFSDPGLGFTTTGPAIIKMVPDKTLNGKWFVVFGSGPTGPIDSSEHQFLGRSDQNLSFFVLDLKTGQLLRKIDTGIQYAFAGSLINSTYDHRLDNYQDDAVYIGYTKRTNTSPFTWTDGGVVRLLTKESTDVTQWTWSPVITGVGPVTTSVTHLYNKFRKILWLFFGTGRYFYELGTNIDDISTQRVIYGIKEPCVDSVSGNFDPLCLTTVGAATLTDVTSALNVPTEDTANDSAFKGWYIRLEPSGSYTYPEFGNSITKAYAAERMITDPVASTGGSVFFTTYKPYSDVCAVGGKSFIWATRYNTGGSVAATLTGKALLQVSTGSIEQKDLSAAFKVSAENPDSKGDRRTGAMEGVPPTAQGLTLMTPPAPSKRVIHFKER